MLFSQRARHAAWRPWGRRGRETTGPSHLPHRHATGGDRSGARGPQWPPWGTSFARRCLGGGVACARALLKEHVSDVLDGLKAVTVPRPSPPAHSRLRPSVRRCLQWCRWPALAAKGRLGALGGRPHPLSDHPSCAYLVTISPRGHAQFSDRMPRTTWLWHGNPSRVSPGTSSRRRCSSRALVHRVHCMAAFARWCLRTVFRQDFVGGQIGNATLRIKFIFQGLKDSKYFQILFYYKPPVTECRPST